MKRLIKKAFLFLIIATTLMTFGNSIVSAESQIKVLYYGEPLKLSQAPVVENNITLVPFKIIFEKLGYSISYDALSKTVIGKKTDKEIKLTDKKIIAQVNNLDKKLVAAPQIINGVLFVPLRFIIEESGMQVGWYPEQKTIAIFGKESLFPVTRGEQSGYINILGTEIISLRSEFSETSVFNEGLAFVYNKGKFAGFINQKGKMVVTNPSIYDAKAFSEGYSNFRIKSNGKFLNGYMDLSGNWVIKPQFTLAHQFSEGLAAVKLNGKYGYINYKGDLLIKPQFDEAYEFNDGLALVKSKNKYFYISKNGKKINSKEFDFAYSFQEGLAVVQIGTKFGYINKSGDFVIPAIYDYAGSFSEGMAVVVTDNKNGYINQKGKVVIDIQFERSFAFSSGLASAVVNEKEGFIDKTGKWVISPKYSWVQPFMNGLSYVHDDNGELYINKMGEEIWRQ